MNKAFLIACVLVMVGVSQQKPHGHHHQNENSSEQKDFDYLVFRQIWPFTSCMFPEGHECTIDDNVKTWVIHGLWPNYNKGYPSFCNKTDKFRPELIESIVPMLEQYWPNLYSDTPLDSFWEHEWEKHGTCALSLSQVTNEKDYFTTTLDLRKKYDFDGILAKASILPDDSKSYELNDIEEAISNALNVEPIVTCYNKNGKQYIAEMQVCLDKSLDLIECKSVQGKAMLSYSSENPCNSETKIFYPSITKQKVIFNL